MKGNIHTIKLIRSAIQVGLTAAVIFAAPATNIAFAANLGSQGSATSAQGAAEGGRKSTISLSNTIIASPLVPNDPGLFNLLIDGSVYAADVGNGGSTPLVPAKPGTHIISETAGSGTYLSNYSVSFACSGPGLLSVTQTGPTSASVSVDPAASVSCAITNTNIVQPAAGALKVIHRSAGASATFSYTSSSAVPNTAVPNDSGVTKSFQIAAPSGASWNESSYTMKPVALPGFPARVTVTQSFLSGWTLTNISCANANGGNSSTWQVSPATATVNLFANEEVACTFTSAQNSYLTVTITTDPAGDNTLFYVNLNAPGFAPQGISSGQTVRYQVVPGAYSVTETLPSGWMLKGTTCQNVMVSAGESVTCTVTNTKMAS